MSHEHCRVWQSYLETTEIVCPHCQHRFHSFPAYAGDKERAAESQRNHQEFCPGIPSCMRGRRRYG